MQYSFSQIEEIAMSQELQELTNKLIDDAENLYGKSLDDWKFSGIEINDRPPFLKYYPETGDVTISLSKKVIDDNLQLIFQLSHEVCHLLHPSLEFPSLYQNQTLVINEGLSTYFSIIKSQEYFDNADHLIDNLKTYSTKYYDAFILVKSLIDLDNDAIKKLRKVKPRIDRLTLEDFKKTNLDIGVDFMNNLVRPFN